MHRRISGPKKTKKIGKHIYHLKGCTAAKTKVNKAHKAGRLATVVGGCAYVGPKRK